MKFVGGALLEGLVELVIVLVSFGIGWFILSRFGITAESILNIGDDFVILLGIIVLTVIFVIIGVLVHWLKVHIFGK